MNNYVIITIIIIMHEDASNADHQQSGHVLNYQDPNSIPMNQVNQNATPMKHCFRNTLKMEQKNSTQ